MREEWETRGFVKYLPSVSLPGEGHTTQPPLLPRDACSPTAGHQKKKCKMTQNRCADKEGHT